MEQIYLGKIGIVNETTKFLRYFFTKKFDAIMINIEVKGVIDSESNGTLMGLWGFPGETFSVGTLQRILDANENDPDLTLDIDCDGGSVEEGFKIYDRLRSSGKNIYTNVTGSCHSMAVVLLLAAPKENRSANKHVRALIHQVYTEVWGSLTTDDAAYLRDSLQMEEDAILEIYAERTETDIEVLRAVMREERVHDAKSLKDLGFISTINSYNTNQFFNKMKKNEKPAGAFSRFMERRNAYRKQHGKLNFAYKDAEGNEVFSTESEEDTLAEGDTVTITSGGTSWEGVLNDGREVTITDNVVASIVDVEPETLEERIVELEEMLEEATNIMETQETELVNLRNQVGSDYTPATRQTQAPKVGNRGPVAPNKTELKEAGRANLDKFKQGTKFGNKKQ